MTQLCVAALISMLIYYNSIRRQYHLTWSDILPPNHSPWRHLYQNGDKGSFINLTGFSREAFEEMHDYLYPNELERHGAGRPRVKCTTRRLPDSVVYLQQKRLESYIYLQSHALTMFLCSVYANPSKSSLRTPVISCASVPFTSSDNQQSETTTIIDNCRGIDEDFIE